MNPVKNISSYLESTLLSPVAKKNEITELCHKALIYRFAAVCVHPYYVSLAASVLKGSTTKVVTVAGFPLGANESSIKAREAELAVRNGAAEIDMVVNLAAVKNGEQELLTREVKSVVECGAIIKVIIETGFLSSEEIKRTCHTSVEGGAHFLKTCTGFGPRGVIVEDIVLLRSCLPPEVGIKASAGIKSFSFASELIEAGANRLGTSAAEAIVQQADNVEKDIK